MEESKKELIGDTGDTLDSGEVMVGKDPYRIILSQSCVRVLPLKKPKSYEEYFWSDVVGAVLNQSKGPGFVLSVYCKASRRLKSFSFKSEETEKWVRAIQSMSFFNRMPSEESVYRRKLKIFINPQSGRGRALRIWRRVSGFFSTCELDITRTTHRNHAAEVIRILDLSSFDAIIVVSGDGLVHEVLNAICNREDKEEARLIPVSVIPAGSANALAEALCNRCGLETSPESCAFIAVKGLPTPFDLTRIKTESAKCIYSFLMFAWAFIADVDIESEVFRCCGACRFDCYGAWRVLFLRRYQGSLRWVDEEAKPQTQESEFLYFLVCNTPFIGEGMNVAPKASIDDGYNDVIYLTREVGRSGLTRVLLNQDGGTHVNLRYLNYLKTNKWSLTPESERGVFSIDGEEYEVEPVKAKVLHNYVTVLTVNKET